ncbi:MAG: DUF3592 domain-containing protein, partial [Betaproteobacteria bacterium]|nr:DUF3592 domain-containing protein [Betaproteobacteria bacterium]
MIAKLASSLFCLMFALPFGAGGAVGIWGLWSYGGGWIKTRSWQPVMVEVQSASLNESRSRKSTSYRTEAVYRYDVEGKSYQGTRVGYTNTSDNVGSWQEDIHHELKSAQQSGRRVLAWYNPRDPQESMVDRSLRWGMLLFMVPFATIFSGVSLGALWILIQIWRDPANAAPLLRQRKSK